MKRNTIADLLTYTAMIGTIYTLLKPTPPHSEILHRKIEARLAELHSEEVRLVATRAYLVAMWTDDND